MQTPEIENTAKVQTIFEAFGRGDVAFILDQLADDVRFTSHLDPIVPWAGEFAGKYAKENLAPSLSTDAVDAAAKWALEPFDRQGGAEGA